MNKSILFVDNDQYHIDNIGTCPGIATLKIPSQEPLYEIVYPPDEYLTLSGLNIKRFIQEKINNEYYDSTSGVQEAHIYEILEWVENDLPDKKILLDFDRTISMCEGIVCLRPKHGALFNGTGIENMRNMFPTYDLTAEGFINYLCGGNIRVNMLKAMFNILYENGVSIYILTNNACCVDNLELFQEFMDVLTGGRPVRFICSYAYGGNKKTAIMSHPELAAECEASTVTGGSRRYKRSSTKRRHIKYNKSNKSRKYRR